MTPTRASCATTIREADPDADKALTAALRDAAEAARDGDQAALASARGSRPRRPVSRRLHGDRRGHRARRRGDREAVAAAARVPHRDPLHAPGRARDARARPAAAPQDLARAAAAQAVRKDLLDAYQARLRELLAGRPPRDRGGPARPARRGRRAGRGLLRDPRAALRRGPRRGRREAGLARPSPRCPTPATDLAGAVERAGTSLWSASPPRRSRPRRPPAAPSSCCSSSSWCRSSTAAASRTTRSRATSRSPRPSPSAPAPSAPSATCATSSPSATARAPRTRRAPSTSSGAWSGSRPSRRRACRPTRRSSSVALQAENALKAAMPPKWTEETDESDYDLIALTLDRMEAAAGAGQYRQAEQARLEAYAFFEFGPERRLRSFDQGLALDVEGLIWFGSADQEGLAKLIAHAGAAARDPRDAAGAGPEARRLRGDAGRLRQQGHGRDQLGDHRLPRGVGGRPDPGRDHGLDGRPAAAAAAPRLRRRARRPGRLDRHLGARADAAAVVGAVRREARGGGGPGGDRRAAADHELVLPQGLLVGVDRQVPPPAQALREAREAGLHLRAGDRPVHPRADERLPRGLRDRALPAVAAALSGDRDRARGRRPRPGDDVRRRRGHVLLPAQAALQEDADRHRRLHRLRARRDGRPDRAHDAGHGLDPDHADRHHSCRTGPACGSASTRRSRRSARRSPPRPS